MRDSNSRAHFHIVTVCRTCSSIEVGGVFGSWNELTEFYDNLETRLNEVGEKLDGENFKRVDVEILIPYEVVRLSAGSSHAEGHDSLMFTHQCDYNLNDCKRTFMMYVTMAMANKLMSDMKERSKRERPSTSKSLPDDSVARRLLDSLDLPDDLFKGIN